MSNLVSIVNGIPQTTSLKVAETFNKRHDDILKSIAKLAQEEPEWHLRNFAEMYREEKIGNGAIRKFPMYTMTRDGAVMLIMGYTGKEARKFKLAYIEAFNKMEAELKRRQEEKALPQTSALSTAADRKEIFSLVGKWAKQKGLFHKDCWKAIHKEFALHSISELPKDKIQDVCNFIAAQMGENLAPAVCENSLPAPKPELTFLPVEQSKLPKKMIDYHLQPWEEQHAEKLINNFHYKDYAYNSYLLSCKAHALFNEYEAKLKDLMQDYDMIFNPVYRVMMSKVMDMPFEDLNKTNFETDKERHRHNDCVNFLEQMGETMFRTRNNLVYRKDTLRNEVQHSIRTLVSIAKLLDM